MIRILLFALVLLSQFSFSHGGGLNSSDCHNQNSNRTYHCHSRSLVGQSFSSQAGAQTALGALNSNAAPTVALRFLSLKVSDTDGLAGEIVAVTATASDSDGFLQNQHGFVIRDG